MAHNTYIQHFSDGTRKIYKRHKQGRKPSGLAKPINVRLWQEDTDMIARLENKMGYLWNTNSFIREAVHSNLCNSVYIELVNT